jgi:CheY-like chemotaxis protein
MARVLVIDDQPDVRAVIRRMLAAAGHEVLEAGDGAAALGILAQHPTDALISDLYMPGMDGLELARELRKLPSRPAIIAISGGGFGRQVDVLDIAAELGAAATLPKPFTRHQLLGAVERVLAKGATS